MFWPLTFISEESWPVLQKSVVLWDTFVQKFDICVSVRFRCNILINTGSSSQKSDLGFPCLTLKTRFLMQSDFNRTWSSRTSSVITHLRRFWSSATSIAGKVRLEFWSQNQPELWFHWWRGKPKRVDTNRPSEEEPQQKTGFSHTAQTRRQTGQAWRWEHYGVGFHWFRQRWDHVWTHERHIFETKINLNKGFCG